MLHIYTGGGTADKEKYIFDSIDPKRKTIIIVPDQFSLQAERDAFRFTGRGSLMELMIVDFSVLGHKVVMEVEGHEPDVIDKYGRHMLLSVIIEELREELETYGSTKAGNAFIDHMNTMISELKRYEISPDMLEKICEELREQREKGESKQIYLSMKLEDILRIYRAYEETIAGTYSDSEDYITYYADRMSKSEMVKDAEIWIYGFDTFTPKHLRVIGELIKHAGSVSVVLTGNGTPDCGQDDPVGRLTVNSGEGLFDLTERVCHILEDLAAENGSGCERHAIDVRMETIWDEDEGSLRERITLVETGDHHHEAERAAAYIQKLVRDEGYRYGQISVVCNDIEGLGGMLVRALQRMDIPVFIDRKRQVLHQPVVSFVLSILDIISRGYRKDAIMSMVKSGLLGWTMEQENLLENYVKEFRIGSNRWKEPFVYSADRYSEADMKELNDMRAFIVDACERARDSIGRRNTAAEKVRGLYDFLKEDMDIPARIKTTIDRQSAAGMVEGASETAQIWNSICGILDQMIKVIGERKISNQTLAEMIRAGFSSLEIGLIPMSGDCIVVGTLQRSRPGSMRALVILGAEEGLLPLHGQDEGLLTRGELEVLGEMDLELARKNAIAAQEEQLAIYRMCSLPKEKLYVSYSLTGSGQVAARASTLFEKLKKYGGRVRGDLEKDDMFERIISPGMTVSYLAEALREGKNMDPRWGRIRHWYEDNDPGRLGRLDRARAFNRKKEKLDEDLAEALYMGDAKAIDVSASRLETFSACPFAHFIKYGLTPREQRLFEVGGREIGDIYHQCIMEYCESMSASEGRPGEAGWSEITREECAHRIGALIDSKGSDYRDGVFGSDEDGRFRMERIREICADIAWAITEQVRRGRIRSMSFEEEFGKDGNIPATEFDINGRKFRLTGRIDRMDTMGPIEIDDGSSVRIIDYKTGYNDIDTDEIRDGYQLQLAVYMDAARRNEGTRPAGIFYFKIKEFISDLKAGEKLEPEELENKIKKYYRLEGVAVKDPGILSGMDEALVSGDKYESTVVPVRYDPKKEDFVSTAGGELMSGEEFSELLDESRKQAERICRELYEGEIGVDPHKNEKKSRGDEDVAACRYCDFGSICMYDKRVEA